MGELPIPIREFIDALTDDLLAPAYLQIDEDGTLASWGGALDSYGISGLQAGMAIGEHLPFLVGMLPLDSGGVFLPKVQTTDRVYADVYLFHRDNLTWTLLLDATEDVKKRQALQQRTYDISLQVVELEHEGRSLYDANSMLGQRVREQTAELSQTVVRLQEELKEGRKVEIALQLSEAKLRSLFDNNVIGIVCWDDAGKVTDGNDAFLSLLGYTRAELVAGELDLIRLSAEDADVDDDSPGLRKRHFLHKTGTKVSVLFGETAQAFPEAKHLGFAVPL